MGRPLKVYLAGPEVFLPDAVALGRAKQALCARYGTVGLFPLDDEAPAGEGADVAIYRSCRAQMREADLGIFNLTPFRGVSADPGTVFELGFMAGLGKPVWGYTNVAADLIERVRAAIPTRADPGGTVRDGQGMSVEDFGNADNLMIDGFLKDAGRSIVRRDVPADGLFRDLGGFELCLKAARQQLG